MMEEQMDCVVHRAQDQVFICWPPPPPLGSMSISSLVSVAEVWQIKLNYNALH